MSVGRANVLLVDDLKLLLDLRDQMLDENKSLAGLLRVCLVLGSSTGSRSLKDWASKELKGYPDGGVVPEYRRIQLPLLMDAVSGNYLSSRQPVPPHLVPREAREMILGPVPFTQPVEDLARMAASDKSLQVTRPGLQEAAALMSADLGRYQEVVSLYYGSSAATFVGILGAVRTTLVEMVIDLTAGSPLTQLPSKQDVDKVVRVHTYYGDHNEINVGSNSGVVGAGKKSSQKLNNGILPEELADLFRDLRGELAEISEPEDRGAVEQAVDDLEEAVSADNPDPENVRRRGAVLKRLAASFAGAAWVASAEGLVQAALGAGGLG